jgi:hypothetical protein
VESGGGLGYQTDAELLTALRKIVHDDNLRGELAHRGYAMRTGDWSEAAHLDQYFGLLQSIRGAKTVSAPHRPPLRASTIAGEAAPRS